MEKGVDFTIHISKNKLSELVSKAVDDAVGREDIEVNGFKVKLRRIGRATVSPQAKSVDLTLPFDVHLLKENGLFTIEGHGSLELHMFVEFDINTHLRANFQSNIKGVEWIEKPVIDIGILNIPMERLIGLIINHYESIITGKIDNKLKSFSDLNVPIDQTLSQLSHRIEAVDTKGMYPLIDVDHIELCPFRVVGDNIQLSGCAHIDNTIRSKQIVKEKKKRGFNWVSDIGTSTYQEVNFSLTYSKLSNLILDQLPPTIQGDKELIVNYIDMYYSSDKLHISADIESPIKAVSSVSALPIVVGQPVTAINAEGVEIKVEPSNIIYKVAVPFVMGFIHKKVTELLPIRIQPHLKKLKTLALANTPQESPIGKMDISLDDIQLHRLNFDSKGVHGELHILKPLVSLTIT